MPKDQEKQRPQDNLVGFAHLADFVGSDKERSTSVFRRFEKLAARNVLYIQSELREIELRLEELDVNDANGEFEGLRNAMDWARLRQKGQSPTNTKEAERLKAVKDLRKKMKEYQEAVLRNAEMLRLNRPIKQAHQAFDGFFHNRHLDDPFPTLAGADEDVYDRKSDLLVLMPNRDEDRLTTFLRTRFPKLFVRGRRQDSGVAYLSANRLQFVVATINVISATTMLFGAIYNLYYVHGDERRLGLIAGYTVGFALCIGLITTARRSEIFGACAAYAAVLVVFVSSDLGSNKKI